MFKSKLDELIVKYKIQPVGNGYIDCIVLLENAINLINDLTDLSITVKGLTWWCHCKESSQECPHGMGGPESKYYNGWFSEMNVPLVEFKNNKQAVEYISTLNDDDVLECFVPALWLDVPSNGKTNLSIL